MLRLLGEDQFTRALWISQEFLLFLLCRYMLISPYAAINYTSTCDFRDLILKIRGCASTPGLKMPIVHLPWLYLFKSVSVFLFHILLPHLFTLLMCCVPALNQDYTMCCAEFPFISGFEEPVANFSQIHLFNPHCPATKCVLA